MQQLLFRKDGSVTVFCTLIMTVLILFFMVLVDYARILLFHRLTESAVMMSIQSVLSAYDDNLYKEYGLFGRGGTDSNRLFRESLSLNHATNINLFTLQDSLDIVPLSFNKATVVPEHYLGEHAVFEQQMLEEMKYKAPIDFTLEVLDTWTKLSDGVNQANSMMDTMNRIEDLFHEREELLEQSLRLHTELGAQLQLSQYSSGIANGITSVVSGYSSYTYWISYEASILTQLQNEELTDEERELLEKDLARYSKQISSYLSSYQTIVRHVQGYEQQLQTTHDQLAEAILEKINASRALNNTIQVQYELYMSNHGSSAQTDDTEAGLSTELSQLTFSDEGLIRENAFFLNYKQAITTQQTDLSNYLTQMNHVIALLNDAIYFSNHNSSSGAKQTMLNNEHEKSKSLHQHYQNQYYSPGSVLNAWKDQIISAQYVKDQLKKDQSVFESEIKGAASLIAALTNEQELEKYRAPYKEIEQKVELNLALNAELDADNQENYEEQYDSGRKQAQAATSQLQSVLKLISNFATAARDHVYINEYIMHRFNHFPTGDSENESSELNVDLLDYRNQEVEYILYGISEPMGNVAMAYGEIFAFRFAIRTIEGLIANRALGNPLLIFSAAVIHGVKEAILDMQQLQSKGNTELSKYIKLPVSYKNYLRLFFLLHVTGKENKYARVIAIIEQNLGMNLMEVPTAVKGEVTSTMHLWSLPGIASTVGAVLPMESRIRGSSYEKTDTFTVSY